MIPDRRSFLLSAATAAAADWPRFRGPNGIGVSSETNLPAEFGPEKNLAWKVDTLSGHSTPIVSGGRVFLTQAKEKERQLLCLDAATGRTQWTHTVQATRVDPKNRINSVATSSPFCDGKTVFAFFPDFGLIAAGVDGNVKWKTELGPFSTMHGMSNSVVVHDGRVFLVADQLGGSYIAAYGAKDGKFLWKTDRPSGVTGGYSTPSIFKDQVIVSGALELTGYDQKSGKRVWWVTGLSGAPVTVPLIDGDRLYVCEPLFDGQQPFEPMLKAFDKNKDNKIQPDEWPDLGSRTFAERTDRDFGNKDGDLEEAEWHKSFAVIQGAGGLAAVKLGGTGDVTKTHILWRVTRGVPYLNSPVVYDNVLYHVRPGGIFVSVDRETGKTLKEGRIQDAIGDYYSSPVAADGKLYIVNNDGKVAVLKAGAQWETLAVNDLGEPSFVTPAIANGRLFVRTRTKLWCFRTAA
ncbi:MAG: hypothetical protein FJW30_16660 [Acidobacteria bacterium]|nr:hypothetical protein [Acidobacteriota bacterium]